MRERGTTTIVSRVVFVLAAFSLVWASVAFAVDPAPAARITVVGGTVVKKEWYQKMPVLTLTRDSGTVSHWWWGSDAETVETATSAVIPIPEGASTFSYYASDASGRQDTQTYDIKVDTGVPHGFATANVTGVEVSSSPVYIGDVRFTVDATDAASGVELIQWYTIDSLNRSSGLITDTMTVELAAPATGFERYELHILTADNAGNADYRIYRDIRVFAPGADVVPPVSTFLSANTWTTSDVYVNTIANDGVGTGVKERWISVDGGTPLRLDGAAGGMPPLVTAEGVTPVTAWSVDWAGNVESVRSTLVRIDRTWPILSHTVDDPAVGSTRITVSATDTPSGIRVLRYSLDGGTWTDLDRDAVNTLVIADPGVHSVDLVTDDLVDHSALASVSFAVTQAASVSIGADRTSAPVSGSLLRLSGRLVLAAGAIPPATPLVLQTLKGTSPKGSVAKSVQVPVAADGTWVADVVPVGRTMYRAVYAHPYVLMTAAAPVVLVTPPAKLSMTAPARVRAGRVLTVRGATEPGTAFVVLERTVRRFGRDVVVARTLVFPASDGRFVRSTTLPLGQWSLRVRRPADPGFAEAVTSPLRVTAYR
ncbi:MAG: hypothetical protein Q7W30_00825 [Coriobacteriia bacterium]|nr:hypothetical protein [Coriobacteriia bacterium]